MQKRNINSKLTIQSTLNREAVTKNLSYLKTLNWDGLSAEEKILQARATINQNLPITEVASTTGLSTEAIKEIFVNNGTDLKIISENVGVLSVMAEGDILTEYYDLPVSFSHPYFTLITRSDDCYVIMGEELVKSRVVETGGLMVPGFVKTKPEALAGKYEAEKLSGKYKTADNGKGETFEAIKRKMLEVVFKEENKNFNLLLSNKSTVAVLSNDGKSVMVVKKTMISEESPYRFARYHVDKSQVSVLKKESLNKILAAYSPQNSIKKDMTKTELEEIRDNSVTIKALTMAIKQSSGQSMKAYSDTRVQASIRADELAQLYDPRKYSANQAFKDMMLAQDKSLDKFRTRETLKYLFYDYEDVNAWIPPTKNDYEKVQDAKVAPAWFNSVEAHRSIMLDKYSEMIMASKKYLKLHEELRALKAEDPEGENEKINLKKGKIISKMDKLREIIGDEEPEDVRAAAKERRAEITPLTGLAYLEHWEKSFKKMMKISEGSKVVRSTLVRGNRQAKKTTTKNETLKLLMNRNDVGVKTANARIAQRPGNRNNQIIEEN